MYEDQIHKNREHLATGDGRAYGNVSAGGTLDATNAPRSQSSIEVLENRLSIILDILFSVRDRQSATISRLAGPRPQADVGKTQPPAPGALGRLDNLVEAIHNTASEISGDLTLIERIA